MATYTFEPKEDITTFELALVVATIMRSENHVLQPTFHVMTESLVQDFENWVGPALRHLRVDKE